MLPDICVLCICKCPHEHTPIKHPQTTRPCCCSTSEQCNIDSIVICVVQMGGQTHTHTRARSQQSKHNKNEKHFPPVWRAHVHARTRRTNETRPGPGVRHPAQRSANTAHIVPGRQAVHACVPHPVPRTRTRATSVNSDAL